jgi:queuine tRNA-ribosyltransferase
LPSGQRGYAYTFAGQVRLKRQIFKLDDEPLDAACDCFVCTRYSRGYLHHLVHGEHALGAHLLTLHNLHHFQALTRRMRAAILRGSYEDEYRLLQGALAPQKEPPQAKRGRRLAAVG